MKNGLQGFAAAIAALAAIPAIAADAEPPYKAPPVPIAQGGFYVWTDAFYERVRLPTYPAGFRDNSTVGFVPVQTNDPRANGGGARGAIGYNFPGSNARVEFGGSYVDAKGTSSLVTPAAPFVAAVYLDGSLAPGGFPICIGGATCTMSGTLATNYTAWQFNGKVATDWKYSWVTVTPSVALFGGETRADQTLNQVFARSNGGPIDTATYISNTSLRWMDFGARAGLDVSTAVTDTILLGIGGWIGGASRATSLSGNDRSTSTAGLGGALTGVGGPVTASDNKFVFLADAEAGVTYKFVPMAALRAFVGVKYDGAVPGITASTINPFPVGIPSHITYAHETGYYAGAGLVVNFGGPIVTRY